jgi:hypothetical protein
MPYLLRSDRDARQRLRRYGVTAIEWKALKARANGQCEICKVKKRVLHIDYDHETGIVRGLLCRKCNLCLGQFGDNLQGLMRVMDYLRGDHR